MRYPVISAVTALTLSAAVFAAHPVTHQPTVASPRTVVGAPMALAVHTVALSRPVSATERQSARRPAVSTVSTLSDRSAVDAVTGRSVTVYRHPNGRVRMHLAGVDALGSRRVLLVTARRSDGWLRVKLPIRPDGTTGWIRRKDVSVQHNAWRVVVSLSHRRLTVLHRGTAVMRYTVGIGSPATPTPTGLFAVTDRILTGDPGGAYGPVAFGLSGFSHVLHTFNGGPGQIAIHGTNESSTIGHAASFGCVHVPSSLIMGLYPELQLGTPVLIQK